MFYLRLVVKKLFKLSFKPSLLIFGMCSKLTSHPYLHVWPTCTHFNLEVFENIFPNLWNIAYWLIPTVYENFKTIAICTVYMQVCSLEVGLKWMENILSRFFFPDISRLVCTGPQFVPCFFFLGSHFCFSEQSSITVLEAFSRSSARAPLRACLQTILQIRYIQHNQQSLIV